MPYDSNGNFSLPAGSFVTSGDTILPSQHNPPLQDISAALSQVLVRDGRAPMLANLPMNGFKVTGIGNGSAPGDAVAVGQLPDAFQSTIAGSTAKSTPVDADNFLILDSEASNVIKRFSWANVKARLKTYFDTLYSVVGHTHTFASLTSKPTTVAGYGITDVPPAAPPSLGIDQTWLNVTGSRSVNTSYKNTTGRSIFVALSFEEGITTTPEVSNNGSGWLQVGGASNDATGVSFVVPSNGYYRVSRGGSGGIASWLELR